MGWDCFLSLVATILLILFNNMSILIINWITISYSRASVFIKSYDNYHIRNIYLNCNI